ncbi:MAG TPA: dihydroorotase [Desulfitobacteriaceae bacterium]|nr:dihydroorotase [Desulfitobacteriaceae bacterium]
MLWLKNVQIVDPDQNLAAIRDLLVKDTRIHEISASFRPEEVQAKAEGAALEVLDGGGRLLFPGLIDVHTHLREPGQEEKEDIASGAEAAVRGGFTTILAMANTKPVIDQRALVEFVRAQGERVGLARVYPVAAVTKGLQGQELVEMMDLAAGGVVGFSDDGHGIQNADIMRLALEYAKLSGLPIISHCEDDDLAAKGVMHKGLVSARLGLRGIPSCAESVMVARDLMLAEESSGVLHLAHISCRQSVDLIRQAKKKGVNVTAEVNPHHLIFCDEDVQLTKTSLKVNPPLRTAEDREALLEALSEGTIDMLATDHAPHAWEEKARPFAEAPFGINGLETSLAAVWQYLVAPGRLSVKRLLEAWSLAPARRFGLAGGSLKPGQTADMVLFDPDRTLEIERENLASKAQNTPFLHMTLQGCPVMTWVGGRLVVNRE